MASNAHKGTGFSSLPIEQGVILPVDFQDKLFPCHWNTSARGIIPEIDRYTTIPDDKFGKAVAVESSTTNMNTCADGTLTVLNTAGTTPPTVQLITDKTNPFGTKVWKITFPANGNAGYGGSRATGNVFTITAGMTIPYSSRCYLAGDVDYVGIYYTGGYGMSTHSKSGRRIGKWVEFEAPNVSVPNIADGGGGYADSYGTYFTIYLGTPQTTDVVVYLAAPQFEQKAWCTSYVEGTRQTGHVRYPGYVIPKGDFTINMWVSHTGDTRGATNQLKMFALGPIVSTTKLTLWNYWPLSTSDTRKLVADYGDGTDAEGAYARIYTDILDAKPFVKNKWDMITVQYNSADNTFSFYRNAGTTMKPVPSTNTPASGSTASPSTNYPVTCLELYQSGWKYSNILISPRIAPMEEIQAWYEYGKPFYDPYDYTAVFA